MVETIELLTPMLSIDSLLFDSDNTTKSHVNDITVHDQNNKNNSSTDSIPSSDENAFVENKKDANLSHMANVHMPMHWTSNIGVNKKLRATKKEKSRNKKG